MSHEPLYRSLYFQTRGDLRKELTACLRTGCTQHGPQGRTDLRSQLPDQVMLSARPPGVEDRAVPGRWEGDLILGKQGKSAVGTLVERYRRYVSMDLSHLRPQQLDAIAAQLNSRPRQTLDWPPAEVLARAVAMTG